MSPSHPHMTVEEFRRTAEAIFKEYFEHGDTRDVAVSQLWAHEEIDVCIRILLGSGSVCIFLKSQHVV